MVIVIAVTFSDTVNSLVCFSPIFIISSQTILIVGTKVLKFGQKRVNCPVLQQSLRKTNTAQLLNVQRGSQGRGARHAIPYWPRKSLRTRQATGYISQLLWILIKRGNVVSRQATPWTYIIIHVCAHNYAESTKRLHNSPFRLFIPRKCLFASHPFIEDCLAYYRIRLVFRLSSTPKRLLGQIPNGVYA